MHAWKIIYMPFFTDYYCWVYGIKIELISWSYSNDGSCALPGKMLLVRIIENNKIDAYFRSGLLGKA